MHFARSLSLVKSPGVVEEVLDVGASGKALLFRRRQVDDYIVEVLQQSVGVGCVWFKHRVVCVSDAKCH